MRQEEHAPNADAEVASEGDVRAAISRLEHDAVARAKLTLAAELVLRRHPRLAHIAPSDLLQNALLRTLQRRRKWYHKRVGFLGHVIGAMRSIASAATKSVARGTIQAEALELVTDDGEAYEVVPLDPTPSAEAMAIENEERAEFESRLEAFHEKLAEDPQALSVYQHLCDGMPKRDIRVALKMSDTKFWTVDRRLSRLVDRCFKNEL